MRWLALLALLSCSAEAQPNFSNWRRYRTQPRTEAPDLSLFRFGTANGVGLGTVDSVDLCQAALDSGALTGNYFCLRGDGTSMGPNTLTTTGSPVTGETYRVCPNGADCSAVPVVRFPGSSSAFATSAQASPAGDVSMCVLVSTDAQGSTSHNQAPIGKSSSINAGVAAFIYADSGGGSAALRVSSDGSAFTTMFSTATNTASGPWRFYCTTYDYVGAANSSGIFYQDASASSPNNTLPGPLAATATIPWRVGLGAGGLSLIGRVRFAFMTEKVLSAAEVTALNALVHASVTDVSGTMALTTTRSTVRNCESTTGLSITQLAPHRPCVTGGGLDIWNATTNVALRSEELTTANWTALGGGGPAAPTVTANLGLAPDGSLTAEKVDYPAVGGSGQYTLVFTTYNPSAGTYTWSFFIKGVSGSGTMTFWSNSAENGLKHTGTCPYTSTAWTVCSATSTLLASTNTSWSVGLDTSPANPVAAASAAQSVYLWGMQISAGGARRPYVRTRGTTATSAIDVYTLPGVTLSATPSYAADVVMKEWRNSCNQYVLQFHNVGTTNTRLESYIESTTQKLRCNWWNGTSSTSVLSTGVVPVGTKARTLCKYSGSTFSSCVDGVCNTSATVFTPASVFASTRLGSDVTNSGCTGNTLDGNISNICASIHANGCD